MDKLIGHASTLDRLKTLRESGRLPHALLFAGVSGVGKKKVASWFVRSLFCSSADASGCDCPTCARVKKKEHPDLLWIFPENGSIRIDAIRSLQQNFRFKPLEANWKIAVVEAAEQLTVAAANALLKILEEPAKNRMILLISKAAGRLPKTILSRCQRIYFGPLTKLETETILKNAGVDFNLFGFDQSSSSPGLVLSWTKEAFEIWQNRFLPAFQSEPKDLDLIFGCAADIADDPVLQKNFLDFLMLWWREQVFLKLGETRFKRISQIADSEKLLEKSWQYLNGFTAIEKTRAALAAHANPCTSFEQLFLRLMQI